MLVSKRNYGFLEEDLFLLPCLGFVDGICCPHYDEEKTENQL